MKLTACVLILLFCSLSFGQDRRESQTDAFGRDNFAYPPGSIVGLGVSSFSYQSEWTVIQVGDLAFLPVHKHQKKEILLFLENRSMMNMGQIHIDVRGEIRFGVQGTADQSYLPDSIIIDKLISDEGTNWAGGAHFKMAYPFDLTPRIRLAPFLGIGVTFVLLEQSGSDLDPKHTDTRLSDLSYESGWNEFSLYSPGNAGINIDFETWSLIFDYRRSLVGNTFTSWRPATPVPEGNTDPNVLAGPPIKSSGQTYQGFGLSLAFRIGR